MLLGKYNKNQKIAYEKIDHFKELPLFIITSEMELSEELEYELKNRGSSLVTNHWHRSIELIYTNQSDGYLILNGHKEYLPKETFYVINSKEIHYLEETNPMEFYTGYAIQISYTFLKENWPRFDEYYFKVEDEDKAIVVSMIDMIIKLYFMKTDTNKETIIYLLKGLIEYLIHHCSIPKIGKIEIKNEKLINILDYLENNYNQELDYKAIAEQFKISYGYFAKLFKENLNMSASQYISEVRMEKAMIDIATTNQTITDIAYKHGFPTSSTFIKEFKKLKGVSPKQYRKMLEE